MQNGLYRGNFWGFKEVSAAKVDCLSFHGHASFLAKWITNLSPSTVMFDHAEVALHDRYGDGVYWRARKSMRFSRALRNIADDFRAKYLNSSDIDDNTVLPEDWTLHKLHRKLVYTEINSYIIFFLSRALGGPYISVHLRRRDFLHARSAQIPSLPNAVNQIKKELDKLDLNTLFVSTDAPGHGTIFSSNFYNFIIKFFSRNRRT